MSRLTSSSFHQPPASFEFPGRAPLSSPVMNSDPTRPSNMTSTISVAGMQNLHTMDSENPVVGVETPGARNRKVSSLAYHSSGFRESRERTSQRNFKSFVVVIPPPSLLQEHGQLGHTLSVGPQHRLSQGILMPLFPTLYGQLTAIAREFNFPSTTGLCIYLHYSSDGITFTPRVSDETWGVLWNHLFDGTSPSQKLPIGGKIEFDIDLRQARWYSAWLFPSQREPVDIPISSVPSTTVAAHLRHESKATSIEDRPFDRHPDSPSPRQPSTRLTTPMSRHVPRNLSLVDRLDTMTIRPIAKPRSLLTPPPNGVSTSQMLSPIHQVEEPKSAKENLENRVKSWRASASLQPTPLAARGQTSLEPANMPNTLTLDDGLIPTGEEELNLEDFTWSVSSQGPGDYEPGSPLSCPRLPSIHIANRMEESVCLTPTDCTSFGPSDYTLSPLSMASFRLPSPDIALRMLEEVPLTPSTATSWGPPSVYPPTSTSDFHAPSLGIGERLSFSRPVTPSTATSWGPASWPPSPISLARPLSVHIAERNGDVSRPATPSTATSWGAPLSFPPSPTTPFYVTTPDVGHRSLDRSEEEGLDVPDASTNGPWRHVWPYTCDADQIAAANAPWRHVWPYNSASIEGASNSVPWKHVWPYTTTMSSNERASNEEPWRDTWPHNARSNIPNEPWKHVWPYTTVTDDLPSVPLDSAPWRHGWPYLSIPSGTEGRRPKVSVELGCSAYPNFIYPAVYPHFDLYPAIASRTEPQVKKETTGVSELVVISITSAAVYPVFNLYPAVYPHNLNEIYRHVTIADRSVVNHVKTDTGVHHLVETLRYNIVADPPINSHITSYPPTTHVDSHERLGVESQADVLSLKGRNLNFEIYPLVGVEDQQDGDSKMFSVRCAPTYPVFNLYPALYPFLEIYPSIYEGSIANNTTTSGADSLYAMTETDSAESERQPISVVLNTVYPAFNLYPPLYPALVIYPPLPEDIEDIRNLYYSSSEVIHPTPRLYLAVYPQMQIAKEIEDYQIGVALIVEYPRFNIYPAVYPHFDLYPSIGPTLEEVKPRGDAAVKLGRSYPFFEIYPAVYPHFDLYPPVNPGIHPLLHLNGQTMTKTHETETAQYPIRKSKTHRQLHEEVFAIRPSSRSDMITVRSTESSIHRNPDHRVSLRLRSAAQVGPPSTPPPSRGLPVRPNIEGLPESNPPFLSKEPLLSRPLPPRPNVHISSGNSLEVASILKRSRSNISSSPSMRREAPHLPSVGEEHTAHLNKSSSMVPPDSEKQKSDNDNYHQLPPRPTTRKRDSLVLQRVRALNTEERSTSGHDRSTSVPRFDRNGFA
ncbi:hypothetical protein IW262DRAFT_426261 [Armillaria fumosa]|nr:hypothetical protein IW262DRAFT_426261 [Armillaria fumosa]